MLKGVSTTQFFDTTINYTRKIFISLKLGVKVIKLFYQSPTLLKINYRVFPPEKFYLGKILFESKARSLPCNRAQLVLHNRISSGLNRKL